MLKGLFKKNNVQLIPPMVGQVLKLEEVPDAVFSGKMIGDGFAIMPSDGKVYAPVYAEVVQLFPTKHAFGLKTASGLEILVHIGIDTVELKGEGFEAYIKAGDKVKAGDLLLDVDLDFLKSKEKSVITPVVFTDKSQYKDFDVTYGSCDKSDKVCVVNI
ncbi:PTS glucose transporter subunit IIA [Acidaminobacter sp. JC074]|uniref:PTS sugar transporter subunit IIA n=1 Tax=Acidaminobacter sp. JC074 TaxID=2530199 RepID=UPI001F0E86C0|nr:PTS glucose transporter subunit IIA [Acidaminobacter sp. JC074]MCH4888768.1 PTS glucose transporter subunit IIA [Acidaminobacter sp. JC074]